MSVRFLFIICLCLPLEIYCRSMCNCWHIQLHGWTRITNLERATEQKGADMQKVQDGHLVKNKCMFFAIIIEDLSPVFWSILNPVLAMYLSSESNIPTTIYFVFHFIFQLIQYYLWESIHLSMYFLSTYPALRVYIKNKPSHPLFYTKWMGFSWCKHCKLLLTAGPA